MNALLFRLSLLLLLLGSCMSEVDIYHVQWTLSKVKGFPTFEEGIEQGVSAGYAGVLKDKLFLAGGCNFPDVPASEGGKKKFYKGIYMAELPVDSCLVWRKVGELPLPLAYGVSAVYENQLLCVGGTDGVASVNQVLSVRLNEEENGVVIDSLPSLPCTLDNMCGTVVGHRLLIAGGNCNGIPSNTFFCLDMQDVSAGWKVLPFFPGDARTQPVCAGQASGDDYRFYLWGGFAPSVQGSEASLSTDGYCFSSKTGQWTPVVAPSNEQGETVSLGGGASVVYDNRWVLFTGGVHKDIFLSALRGPDKDYMLHAPEWYRFNDCLFLYDMDRNVWKRVLTSSYLARAGAMLVGDVKHSFYNINGELKPGVRTSTIMQIQVE